jgi:signal transduction histidine kinase
MPLPPGNTLYRSFQRYGAAILAVAAATLLRKWLDPILGARAPFSTYYLAVMVIAWYARLGPALLTIVLGAGLANYFFIEPRGSILRELEHQVSFGLFLAVGSFIAAVCESFHRDIAKRKRVEAALKDRTAELERAGNQLQQEQHNLKRLMELQDRERQLIGFEIHDGLAQSLTAAKMHLESFRHLDGQDPAAAKEAFQTALEALAHAIREARGLINNLTPPSLDEGGVVGAIDDLIRESQRREGCEVELVSNVAFDRLPRPLENTIVRVVQESLTNACRHSGSQRFRVELSQVRGRLRIEVRDWGIGFDPQSVGGDRFGLESIRQRARAFGGQATIESLPEKGTRVVVELPLPDVSP